MRVAYFALVGLLIVAGCTKPTSAPPAPPISTAPAVTLETPPKADTGLETGLFAKEFLAALHEGKATPAQLTPAFKKTIAEPVFDADRTLGYSDSATENWLKQFQGKLAGYTLTSPRTDTVALFTGGIQAEKPLQLLLRLARHENRWAVDWFSLAEVNPADSPAALTPQSFAASAFLQSLLGHKDDLAAGAMTTGFKKSLAPALGSETRLFNVGILKIKLNGYRGAATGYTLVKAEGGTASGELIHAGGKRPFALKLVAGERPDEWLVDEIKVD
jgi:hypothetical protein